MRHLLRFSQIIALLATWFMLYFLLMLLTEFVLVPWDTAIVRPEVGTLPRTLNDFFEAGIGAFLLSIGMLLLNGWFLLRGLRRGQWRVPRLLLNNVLLIVTLPLLFTVTSFVNNWLHPYPPVNFDPDYLGYHRSVLPLLTSGLLLIVWLRAQLEATRDGRKRKREAQQAETAHTRLALAETAPGLTLREEAAQQRGNLSQR